jgi:hypothetical protein
MPPIDLPVPTSTLVALDPKFPNAAMSVIAELAGATPLVQELPVAQTVPVLFQVNTGAGLIVIVKVCALLVPKGLVAV